MKYAVADGTQVQSRSGTEQTGYSTIPRPGVGSQLKLEQEEQMWRL